MMTILVQKSRSIRIPTNTKINQASERICSWKKISKHRSVLCAIIGLITTDRVSAQPLSGFDLAAQLAVNDSASVILKAECAQMAPGQTLRSVPLNTASPPHLPGISQRLKVGHLKALKRRHVSIRCGVIELSNAWNWYVPSRLTPEMNVLLDKTETPFGLVTRSLNFSRESETGFPVTLEPGIILQHRALLYRGRDHTPFAYVIENYTEKNLPLSATETTISDRTQPDRGISAMPRPSAPIERGLSR